MMHILWTDSESGLDFRSWAAQEALDSDGIGPRTAAGMD